jgi:hypothetical protein
MASENLIGKSILVKECDLLEPAHGRGDSEQRTALRRAIALYKSDVYENEFTRMSIALGASPEFHAVVGLAASGALAVRDIAAICYLAGVLGAQQQVKNHFHPGHTQGWSPACVTG